MDARQYLDTFGRTAAISLCERARTKYSYFKHLANGAKRPGVDLAHRLVKESGGKLTLEDLLRPSDQLRDAAHRHKSEAAYECST